MDLESWSRSWSRNPKNWANSQNFGRTLKILAKLPKYWAKSQFFGQAPKILGNLPKIGQIPKYLAKLQIFPATEKGSRSQSIGPKILAKVLKFCAKSQKLAKVSKWWLKSQNTGQTPKNWPKSQNNGETPKILGKLPKSGQSPIILGNLPKYWAIFQNIWQCLKIFGNLSKYLAKSEFIRETPQNWQNSQKLSKLRIFFLNLKRS